MMFAKIGQSRIWENEKQKLIGVTIDKHLKFKEHIVKQCKHLKFKEHIVKQGKTAGQKLCALIRVYKILNQERPRTLMKVFINPNLDIAL